MKVLLVAIVLTINLFTFSCAQMMQPGPPQYGNPQYGSPQGPQMQGNPQYGSPQMQGNPQYAGGPPPGAPQMTRGGGPPQQQLKTEPCLNPQPQDGVNMTGILSGKWYVSRLYSDLMDKKPEVAALCLFLDITPEEVSIGTLFQGNFKNLSGNISSKNNGEFLTSIMIQSSPAALLPMKTVIIDQDGDNVALYNCGGQGGVFLHVGFVLNRQKIIDNTYNNKVDAKFKTLEFKLEGMSITNQNCPN